MVKFDVLDFGVYLDGKHIADFDDLDEAKEFAYIKVDEEKASGAVVVGNFTGEVCYTVDEVLVVKTERKVVEGN